MTLNSETFFTDSLRCASSIVQRQYQEQIDVATAGPGLHDITSIVRSSVRRSLVHTGLCTLFAQHTSCSLVIQENADAAVRTDLQTWLEKVAPRNNDWKHREEGDDDMPAHARAAITGLSLSIPIYRDELTLGRWQAIYLWEHRNAPRRRHLIAHVLGTLGGAKS